MEILRLKNPFPNGIKEAELPRAEEFLRDLEKAYDALQSGRMYIRYIDGDRKGAVAKAVPNPQYCHRERPRIEGAWRQWDKDIRYEIKNTYFYVVCTWKGRRNKVQEQIPRRDVEIIIGDDVETVWALFDAKAAKEDVLKNPDQKDIDGNVLAIGDRVMFINISYGSRMYLQRGTVKEFKAVVNSSTTTITTIIANEKGETSKLHHPYDMVLKI